MRTSLIFLALTEDRRT